MRLALAFLKRDFLVATSYKTAFALQMAGIFLAVPLFFFIGRMFEGTNNPMLSRYGGSYFAFLLIGIAFIDYMGISLKTFNDSLRESQLMGTLEIILLSPTTLPKLLIFSSLWGYTFTSTRFILYLLLGLIFGLDLGNAHLGAAFLILAMAIVCFASCGILIASITMVIKRGEALNAALAATSIFLGGVLYPTSVLPEWLRVLSKALPITYALEGMRLALIEGYGIRQLLPQISALALFSVVLFPAGLLAFRQAVRWTKVTGSLAQY